MAKLKFTQQQIENIRDHENDVEKLENFIEAVQTMPTMYIGHKSNQGYLNMIREVFQNSIDEVMRAKSPCDHVWITIDENTAGVIIEDNGRGIPFSLMIDIYSTNHVSSNYKKEEGCGDYTSGTHGVGAKVTNALSSKFIVESYVLGEARRAEFTNGILWEDGLKEIPCEDRQGTMVSFFPNVEIMGHIELNYIDVLSLIRSIVPLTTIGTVVTFKAILRDGKTYSEDIISNGPVPFLEDMTDNKFISMVNFKDDNGTTRANILFTYDSGDLETDKICGFSNFCPCIGSHIDGFKKAIGTFFKNYMNNVFLATTNNKKSKLKIVPADIEAGLRAVIDVAHINPTFTGQAKEILTNNDMELFVKNLTLKGLEEWTKDNPTDLQNLCRRFKDVAEVRLQSEKTREKISTKYKNTIHGMPPKFVKPITSNWEELIICEGDSAAGSMSNNRDNKTQAVFPIRGKIKNISKGNMESILKNEEVRAIITIIGAGYGKSFDLSKVRFKKIIIMADADVDGSHISNLLLTLFLVLMPDLIKDGRVYRAMPPLYRMGTGKDKVYFFDKMDYNVYLRDLFSKNNDIRFDNKYQDKLSDLEILNLLTVNENYLYEIANVASNYIDPKLLEFVLMNRHLDHQSLINLIRKNPVYRFLNIEVINNTVTIRGSVNKRINTLFLNDKLYYDCRNIIDIMENNKYLTYLFNGQRVTLYDIMKVFKELEPKSLQRFKGLGEMDPPELAQTTVFPGDKGNRVLVRYTFEDAKAEIEKIRYMSSNTTDLLKDLRISRDDIF